MTFSLEDSYYLGLDLSTQQLKCLAINQNLTIIHSETVEFSQELPKYKTNKGVYIEGDRIESPVAMWLEAIDLVFTKFQQAGFPLSRVLAISGSCQQHGSVFWSHDASKLLYYGVAQGHASSLVEQLVPKALARNTAPNWQDHSTSHQCQQMESIVGGPEEMANITGSKAHLRFTGPQILKIVQGESTSYENTETISLVSNFLSSVLCGKLIKLEEADACGMNLYDVKKRKFYPWLTNFIDQNDTTLQDRRIVDKLLGEPIRCGGKPENLGPIGKYFISKYGFQEECSIFPMTGDNLATICSLPLEKNDVLVSLGTSTTVLLVTDQYHPSPKYHLFIHPTIPDAYMGMICYCNGSLAREKIRDELNHNSNQSWEQFNEAVLDHNLDTSNEIGIYFPLAEIVPQVPAMTKRLLFNKDSGELTGEVAKFSDTRHDAKNIVESQALSCRIRISPLLNSEGTSQVTPNTDDPSTTFVDERPKRVFFVGGGSKNDAIVQKFAEILGSIEGSYRIDTPNSCALGGCYKAFWSDLHDKKLISDNFDTFLQDRFPWDELEPVAEPNRPAWEVYGHKVTALRHLESHL